VARDCSDQPKRISLDGLRGLTATQWTERLNGPPEAAARWVEAAARYGLVEAQTALGQMLLDGRGVPRDQRAALGWFEIAAGAGHAPAINMLGRCRELGWGGPIDLPAAAACYRRAAAADLDWGQYNYANMLLRGRGVARDPAAAFTLYRRAAAQGHAKSINMVGRFYEEGWETPADPRAAAACYRRAAESGDFRAQYNWASLLVRHDKIDQAVPWLRRAMRSATKEFRALMAQRLAGSPDARLRAISAAEGKESEAVLF
jgi:TPR repeat protein